MGYFITDNMLVRFEVGEGFYDRIVRTTSGKVWTGGEKLNSEEAAGLGDWLQLELEREESSLTEFHLGDAFPTWLQTTALGARIRNPGDRALWSEGGTRPDSPVRRVAPAGAQLLEPDSQIWRMIGFSLSTRVVVETRHYGWPLRCMSVHGIRIQRWTVADPERDDLIFVLQDDHSTDALLDFEHHANWSFDADQPPATGLPRQPLWTPFLANSLALGAPFVLLTVGFIRALGWAGRQIRGSGNKCSNCGYPRSGIAQGSACPECGMTRACKNAT
jgi:hypothetical protein